MESSPTVLFHYFSGTNDIIRIFHRIEDQTKKRGLPFGGQFIKRGKHIM